MREKGRSIIKLSGRNYFEIGASLAFLALGLVILSRSLFETGRFMGVLVGAAFSAYGAFRLRYIWRYFFPKGQKS